MSFINRTAAALIAVVACVSGCAHPVYDPAASIATQKIVNTAMEAADQTLFTEDLLPELHEIVSPSSEPLYELFARLPNESLQRARVSKADLKQLEDSWYQIVRFRIVLRDGTIAYPPMINKKFLSSRDAVYVLNGFSREALGDIAYYENAIRLGIAEGAKEFSARTDIPLRIGTEDDGDYRIPVTVLQGNGSLGHITLDKQIHFSEKIGYWHETKTPRIRFRTEQIKELVVHYSALGKYGYDTIERLVATRIRKAFVHELLHAAGLWHSKDATDAMFARQGDRIVRIPRSSVIGDRVTDEEGSSICLDDEMIIIKREVGEFDFFIGDESPAYAQITSDHPGSTDTSNVLARFLRYAALHIL